MQIGIKQKYRATTLYFLLFLFLSLLALVPPIYVTIMHEGICEEKTHNHFASSAKELQIDPKDIREPPNYDSIMD